MKHPGNKAVGLVLIRLRALRSANPLKLAL
jgi:hypothetical protein